MNRTLRVGGLYLDPEVLLLLLLVLLGSCKKRRQGYDRPNIGQLSLVWSP